MFTIIPHRHVKTKFCYHGAHSASNPLLQSNESIDKSFSKVIPSIRTLPINHSVCYIINTFSWIASPWQFVYLWIAPLSAHHGLGYKGSIVAPPVQAHAWWWVRLGGGTAPRDVRTTGEAPRVIRVKSAVVTIPVKMSQDESPGILFSCRPCKYILWRQWCVFEFERG